MYSDQWCLLESQSTVTLCVLSCDGSLWCCCGAVLLLLQHAHMSVIACKVQQCLLAGSKGVGQIFAKVPQIMLCKPSTNDRWDRRVVQLAAFMHRHGHCNVPEVSKQFSLFDSPCCICVVMCTVRNIAKFKDRTGNQKSRRTSSFGFF